MGSVPSRRGARFFEGVVGPWHQAVKRSQSVDIMFSADSGGRASQDGRLLGFPSLRSDPRCNGPGFLLWLPQC